MVRPLVGNIPPIEASAQEAKPGANGTGGLMVNFLAHDQSAASRKSGEEIPLKGLELLHRRHSSPMMAEMRCVSSFTGYLNLAPKIYFKRHPYCDQRWPLPKIFHGFKNGKHGGYITVREDQQQPLNRLADVWRWCRTVRSAGLAANNTTTTLQGLAVLANTASTRPIGFEPRRCSGTSM